MTTYHLVKVSKLDRRVEITVRDPEEVINYIECLYTDNIEFLRGVSYDDFEKEVKTGNTYTSGLFIIEETDSINVYRVKTDIYYGYIYNSAQRNITLEDRFELVVQTDDLLQ